MTKSRSISHKRKLPIHQVGKFTFYACFLGILLFFLQGLNQGKAQVFSLEEVPFDSVKKESIKKNKPLFILVCAGWSPSCGDMTTEPFELEGNRQFLEQNFVPWYLDTWTATGMEMSDHFRVTNLPCYLVYAPNGEHIYRGKGNLDSLEARVFMESALDSAKNFRHLEAEYQNGNREPDFLREYIRYRFFARKSLRTPVGEYLNPLPDSAFFQPENLEIMYFGLDDFRSRAYQFVLKNRDTLIAQNGAELIDGIIIPGYKRAFEQALETGDSALFAKVQNITRTVLDSLEAEETLLQEQLLFAEATQNWGMYASVAPEWVKQTPFIDPELLNELAWNYYQHVGEREALEEAVIWTNSALYGDTAYYILDTKASLLYKLEKLEEAEEIARLAIQWAKKTGEDSFETQKLLQRILSEK